MWRLGAGGFRPFRQDWNLDSERNVFQSLLCRWTNVWLLVGNARWFSWSRRCEYEHRVFGLSIWSHRKTSASKRLHASQCLAFNQEATGPVGDASKDLRCKAFQMLYVCIAAPWHYDIQSSREEMLDGGNVLFFFEERICKGPQLWNAPCDPDPLEKSITMQNFFLQLVSIQVPCSGPMRPYVTLVFPVYRLCRSW